MQAIGLVETRGLLAAIECADVMLKAAHVELVERTFVGGGLVTVIVTGDVGAVKAAVDAGASAVERLSISFLISRHVIPRPHSDIGFIIGPPSPGEPAEPSRDSDRAPENETEDDTDTVIPIEENPTEIPVQASEVDARKEDEPETHAPSTVLEEADDVQEQGSAQTQVIQGTLKKSRVDELVRSSGIEKGVEVLRVVTVEKLRSLAKEYKGFGITGRALAKSRKDDLLKKFREYYGHEQLS